MAFSAEAARAALPSDLPRALTRAITVHDVIEQLETSTSYSFFVSHDEIRRLHGEGTFRIRFFLGLFSEEHRFPEVGKFLFNMGRLHQAWSGIITIDGKSTFQGYNLVFRRA